MSQYLYLSVRNYKLFMSFMIDDVIGSSPLSESAFNGHIDNLKKTTRVKTANEILTAGTTVVYFSFDEPNKMSGTISNAISTTGKVSQGLAFNGGTYSYLQIFDFYQMGLSNRATSISLWVNPYSVTYLLVLFHMVIVDKETIVFIMCIDEN